MPVIKRYPNRKLYNTEDKQYITLGEIAELIRQGKEIKVIDNATGEDLTALTLSQIIFEQEKKHRGFLPHSVLTGLIQTGGDRLIALQNSFLSSFSSLYQVDEEIKSRIEILVSRGELAEREGKQLLNKLLSLSKPWPAGRNTPIEAYIEEFLTRKDLPSKNDLDQLVLQLDDLNSKLDRIYPGNE